jgi:DNA repair protein RadC
MVLLLDAQNRLFEARELFRGTVSQTVVYPREVMVGPKTTSFAERGWL